MLRFLCKTLAFGHSKHRSNVRLLRWFSTSSDEEERPFVTSYLIKSLGFSPKAALHASKLVRFDSPEKPDEVIEFFKGYGFTQSQIAKIARLVPSLLLCNTQKFLKPKFEFFMSNGLWSPKLIERLSSFPIPMRSNLANQIVPAHNFLRRFFKSDEAMMEAVTRLPSILTYNIKNRLEPNISTLSQYGVSDSKIAVLMFNSRGVIVTNTVQFREIVKQVAEMGFDASKVEFVLAVRLVHQKLRSSKWEGKVKAYKKCGWSDEDVLKAFRKNPLCMMVSEDKIAKAFAFFVEKVGLKPGYLAEQPLLLLFSLEKRIIPRVSYYQALISRGLVEKEVKLITLLKVSEKTFLQKFVAPFAEENPELPKFYRDILLV